MPEEEEPQRSGTGARREEPMAPTGATEQDEVEAARMANRFDIRRLIGAVFVLYGLILLALGIFGSHAVKTKAAGHQHQPLDRDRDADLRWPDDLLGVGAPS